MTDNQYKRAVEIKRLLKICDNMLGFEKAGYVEFANNDCSFIKKELFEAVKKKKAELESEYNAL